MEPQISIIIPVYNVPEIFLRKCLESVCKQTLKNLEVVVVDDGSTDNSGMICDEFRDKDSRIVVIHKDNGGLAAARNTGYQNAHAKWIMFVDGDDWIEPDMCETMLQRGEANSVDIVMCGLSKDYGNSSTPYRINLEEDKIYKGSECKYLQEQLLHYNSNIAMAYCKLIKKSCLSENGIIHNPDLRQGAEGLEFNLRLYEHVDSVLFINKPFYHYIYNDNSISASHNEKNHLYVVKCFESIKELIGRSENKENLIHWFNNRLLYVIITTAISGYFNPENKESYSTKKRKYKEYLKIDIIRNALYSKDYQELSFARRVVLYLIKNNMYMIICCLAYARKWQKKHK